MLEDSKFILYGPASVGIVDLLRVQSLIGNQTRASCPDTDVRTPDGLKLPADSCEDPIEPETARNGCYNSDIEFDSQQYLATQSSFHAFSPQSPISPIQYKPSQSPPPSCTSSVRSGRGYRHYQDSSHNSSISELLYNSMGYFDEGHEDDSVASPSGADSTAGPREPSRDDSMSGSSVAVALSQREHSSLTLPQPLPPMSASSEKPSVAAGSSVELPEDISLCFTDQCSVAEHNQDSRDVPRRKKALTQGWTLPLHLHVSSGDSSRRIETGRHARQAVLCSHTCASHSHSDHHSSGQSSLDSDAARGLASTRWVDELGDRLDAFNAEMVRFVFYSFNESRN